MALLRQPEYCISCGQLLEEMHTDQSHLPIEMQIIGDNFIGYKPHNCKPEGISAIAAALTQNINSKTAD